MSKKTRKIELTITQDERDTCYVEELDVENQTTERVAIFPAGSRTVTVRGEFGPELAIRDMAQIRAGIFVQIFDRLVNGGEIEW